MKESETLYYLRLYRVALSKWLADHNRPDRGPKPTPDQYHLTSPQARFLAEKEHDKLIKS